ncbi:MULTISPECIES: alpha/beta hydrolase [Myxococcaceae]|uniref:alpha/beta hydrolase n=1 Tax=Myxococcaceae TaxID=31 RepID=UPI00188DCA0B|nr:MULTISPECIES: alpha/beta hydrolase [Myxococcaceae]MBF5044839.1 alpha/beta hydrolase [Simulacricoccus sp. 17bor-14]
MARRLRAALVAAVLAAPGAALWAGRLQQRGLLRFPLFAAPLSEAGYVALGSRPGWSPRLLEVAPGVRVRGLVHPPRAPGLPTVLFFSGNADAQLSQGQQFLEALGGAEGYGLAVFAYRGYDGSEGTPTPEALRADGARVYAALREGAWAGAGPLHVVGFSLGTGVASAVAADVAPPPASLTLLAPYTELVVVRPSPLARLLPGDRYDARPALARVLSPALVVHGDADASLPVQMGRAVHAALGPTARYLELPGAGHVALLSDPRALQAVRDFIGEAHVKARAGARTRAAAASP